MYIYVLAIISRAPQAFIIIGGEKKYLQVFLPRAAVYFRFNDHGECIACFIDLRLLATTPLSSRWESEGHLQRVKMQATCRATRYLHRAYGMVHTHGLQANPFPLSKSPSLSLVAMLVDLDSASAATSFPQSTSTLFQLADIMVNKKACINNYVYHGIELFQVLTQYKKLMFII